VFVVTVVLGRTLLRDLSGKKKESLGNTAALAKEAEKEAGDVIVNEEKHS